jgi:hypothetical protein
LLVPPASSPTSSSKLDEWNKYDAFMVYIPHWSQ